MRLLQLTLENIGPFEKEVISFIKDEDNKTNPPVTIITGDNGSGKSIILDAIINLFSGAFSVESLKRSIVANESFHVHLTLLLDRKNINEFLTVYSSSLDPTGKNFQVEGTASLLQSHFNHAPVFDSVWFFDYWTSKISNGGFELTNLTLPTFQNYLHGTLSGLHHNIKVSESIVFFDYLKSSDDKAERLIGNEVFEAIKTAVRIAVTGGELINVSRSSMQPIIRLRGVNLTLDKLSSGNIYVLQRLISIITKAYSVIAVNKDKEKFKSIFSVPGVLLIDEAENHLHPNWQKTLLSNIVELFPYLQVIVTTHSPFIISSVKNANIYVCKVGTNGSKIVDETDVYSNMPIDEILTTDLFNTLPFNNEISDLMTVRNIAILQGDKKMQNDTEEKLVEINPQYFSYLTLDRRIEELYRNK